MEMSNMSLKRLVFMEPALPFPVKQYLMTEIDQATDNPRGSVSASEIVGGSLGGIAGFMLAKATGAGPITTGISTILGALGGQVMGSPVQEEETPGFRTYY